MRAVRAPASRTAIHELTQPTLQRTTDQALVAPRRTRGSSYSAATSYAAFWKGAEIENDGEASSLSSAGPTRLPGFRRPFNAARAGSARVAHVSRAAAAAANCAPIAVGRRVGRRGRFRRGAGGGNLRAVGGRSARR